MSTLLIFVSVFLVSITASALFLWVGAKWAKIPLIGLPRALAATLLIGVFSTLEDI